MADGWQDTSNNTNIRYTYLIDISDIELAYSRFEKRLRYDIRNCNKVVVKINDVEAFDRLHLTTRPDRVIGPEFIGMTYWKWYPNVQIYSTGNAMAMIGWAMDKGFYLLAARDKSQKTEGAPAKIIWQAMKDLSRRGIKEFDMCGCNKPNIELFKRSFGGKKIVQEVPCLSY